MCGSGPAHHLAAGQIYIRSGEALTPTSQATVFVITESLLAPQISV